MLDDFPVPDAEHVEPGGGVFLASGGRVRIFPDETKHDQVALGHDRHQWRLDARCDWFYLRKPGKELDESLAAAGHGGIVLDVGIDKVFVRQFEVTGFQYLAPEIVDKAFVGGQFGIRA